MGLWGLMGPMGHIFLSSHPVNGLACGYLSEIREIFKKWVIWLHFPILELKSWPRPDGCAPVEILTLRRLAAACWAEGAIC